MGGKQTKTETVVSLGHALRYRLTEDDDVKKKADEQTTMQESYQASFLRIGPGFVPLNCRSVISSYAWMGDSVGMNNSCNREAKIVVERVCRSDRRRTSREEKESKLGRSEAMVGDADEEEAKLGRSEAIVGDADVEEAKLVGDADVEEAMVVDD
ncbi:hypothetical protein L2E82_33561 [Cichorium intybus]|uniref:Uncharacterized protein n=1 Tax=Cichorium intybus TaxID=13427 RepID=A0ACB9BKG5_CICIN|nr:hypothetical protein L2E82_33561 [Cichorium intybus]